MRRYQRTIKSQAGMTSFMVTTVLILVIGLIVAGFSQSVRRNQRETLDRQLSTQAFYAAESGVNAAAAIARNAVANGTSVPTQDDCAGGAYPDVELADNVAVTCMLVNANLESLYYSSVTEDEGTLAAVVAADPSETINAITITWHSKAGSATPTAGCGFADLSLPAKDAWPCDFGMLRTDLAPGTTGDPNSVAMSNFFKPQAAGGTPSVAYPAGGGGLSYGNCTDGGGCRVQISGLSGSAYYLRLRSIYRDASVTITAQSGGSDIELSGQALIDVTARAQDVLRRIQVRVPLYGQSGRVVPVFGLESTESLCKRYSVAPGLHEEDTSLCS